jgi:hypothetical protein
MKTSEVVLSGNGFLDPVAAPILAAIVGAKVWMPPQPGLASLRGSGVCGLQALGEKVSGLRLKPVVPVEDSKLAECYHRYRILRALL